MAQSHCLARTAAAIVLTVLMVMVMAGVAQAKAREVTLVPPQWERLAEQLVRDGFARGAVAELFGRPEVIYTPEYMGKKIRALSRIKYGVPERRERARAHVVRRRDKRSLYDVHLTPDRLATVRVFYEDLGEELESAELRFGIPRELVMAILVVETRLGEFLGVQSAFNSLASMAATGSLADIPGYLPASLTDAQREYLQGRLEDKAGWAYIQLKALIDYASLNGLDPVAMPGSIYGAIGMCQFIPTTALERGVDGDGDGRVDLFEPADAVHSVGNFLKKAGWQQGLNGEGQVKVIRRYNNDEYYARVVLRIASML